MELFSRWAVAVLCVCAGTAAAAEPDGEAGVSPVPAVERPTGEGSPADYLIGPDDTLAVAVRNYPELSEIIPVRPDGYITLPLLEDVRAAGRTSMELAAEIEERLRAFVVEPDVMVEVLEAAGGSREIRIIGEVAVPRPVPFTKGMTVLDVLTGSGGLSPYADGNATVLVRGSGPRATHIPLRLDDLLEAGDSSADIAVQPGDIIIVPRGFFAGDWRTTAAVSFSQTFTDNVSLDPDGQRDPALISALTPSIELSGTGGRFTGALAAAVSGEYQALSDSGLSAQFNVLGRSNAELVRDSVFVDALGSITEQPLQTNAATSGAESNDTNLTTVQAYSLSPYWVSRLNGFADIEARYIFGATITGDTGGRGEESSSDSDSDTLANSVTNGAVVSLRSAEDIAPRVQLQQTTYGLRTTRFGASDVTSAGGSVTPTYSVAPGLALLATGGYDVLDAGDEDLSGPNGSGGFRYQPSPTFRLNATAGWRLEHPEADVLLRYDIGPRTVLAATYDDSVAVGQTNLLQNLSNLGYDPVTGRFINQQTSLAFSSALTGVDISDQLSRTQLGTITLDHRRSRDDFQIGVYAARQRDVGGSGEDGEFESDDQDSWGVSAGWGRKLAADFGISTGIGFAYTDAKGDDTGEDADEDRATGTSQTFFAAATLTHSFSDKLLGFVGYRFQQRFADDSDDEFTENAIILGVTQRF